MWTRKWVLALWLLPRCHWQLLIPDSYPQAELGFKFKAESFSLYSPLGGYVPFPWWNTLYLVPCGFFLIFIFSKIEHSRIYGALWKSKYGPLVVVNVASAELIEQVLRQEGRHPVRTDMPHWRTYRELRNQAHGPLTEWVILTINVHGTQEMWDTVPKQEFCLVHSG